jgi:hypothetical protein
MSMHYCQQGKVKPTHYVVTCKKCARAVPTGVTEWPRINLVVGCPLCGELRRYRPSEVFLGFPDHTLDQQRCRAAVKSRNYAIRPHLLQ